MTWTAWFALVVTATVVIGLARNMAADALLWGAVIACGLVGILTPAEMFTGFANTGMLTIAALYVVASVRPYVPRLMVSAIFASAPATGLPSSSTTWPEKTQPVSATTFSSPFASASTLP